MEKVSNQVTASLSLLTFAILLAMATRSRGTTQTKPALRQAQ